MAAFGRRSKASTSESGEVTPRKSLVASAIRTNLSELSYNLWRFRDESWQRELWRFYDIIPEFGFAARWVGQCCSKVRIYVAKVDELGRIQNEVKDPRINALADTLLGGPAAKAEALRALGINLTVAGECYIVGRPGDEGTYSNNPRDEWYVLSSSELRRVQSGNGEWQWAWYLPDGNPFTLDLQRNVVTRVWTPHPMRVWCADSPARACQMVLRELEQLTKYVFSQIDSRLVGAGILVIPNDLDLPADGNSTNASESLMYRLATAGAQSLRGEGSALGVLPHIVESSNADGWKLLTFESELSKQAQDLRKEAVNRLGVGLDMPAEVLTGLGESNHWCLSADTEILTRDKGWVQHTDLEVGDQVMTLDHETGLGEWQPAQAVNVFDVVDEPVLSLESRTHSSLSTANHRWPVVSGTSRSWQTSADDFNSAQGIPVAARNRDIATEAKYTDDLVKLVAAYTSDGTLRVPNDSRPSIHITKFQHPEIVELRRVIMSLFDSSLWSETVEYTAKNYYSGTRFHLRREAVDLLMGIAPGGTRPVSIEFVNALTEAQLRLFLDSMIELGDGIRTKAGYTFFQVEQSRLEAVERAAIILGFSVTWALREQTGGAFETRPLHVLQVSHRRATYPAFAKPTWTTYTGKVWCPTTANGTWLARRNGKVYYTGNSGFLIDGYGIKVHIEPLMNRICDALTKAYLTPALKLMGKDPARYTYAYDTSPLVLRPQRLQDALNLYEKGAISAQALREAGYFKYSDAPDQEEDVERFLREIMLRDPQLLQNQAIREATGIPEDIIPQSAMIAPTPMSVGMGPGGGTPGIEGGLVPENGVMGPSGPPPPPAPPTGIQSELPPPMPTTFGDTPRPPTGVGLQASAMSQRHLEEYGVMVVAEASVRRGMALAGKRLLDRNNRNLFPDTPAYELHTRIKVQDQARANRLLLGAWDQLDGLVDYVAGTFDIEPLKQSLDKYCSFLLLSGIPHDPQQLLARLRADGVIHV